MVPTRFSQIALSVSAICFCFNLACAEKVTVSLMTWNCMQFPTTLSVFDWDQEARADRMAAAIRALSPAPDVIGFQEVLNDKAITAIQSLKDLYPYQTEILGTSCTGLEGVWNSIHGDCQKLDWNQIISSGVMMISKHPYVSVNAAYFDNHAGLTADSFAAKGVIYAEIAVESKYRVHIVNTHLQSDAEVWEDSASSDTHNIRISQLEETKAYLDGFSIPAAEPVIIMGDLNVRKDNSANYNAMLAAAGPTTDDLNDPGTGTVSCLSNWASNWFKVEPPLLSSTPIAHAMPGINVAYVATRPNTTVQASFATLGMCLTTYCLGQTTFRFRSYLLIMTYPLPFKFVPALTRTQPGASLLHGMSNTPHHITAAKSCVTAKTKKQYTTFDFGMYRGQVVPMTFSPTIMWGGSDALGRDGGMYGDLSDHYAVQQSLTFELAQHSMPMNSGSVTPASFWHVTVAMALCLVTAVYLDNIAFLS